MDNSVVAIASMDPLKLETIVVKPHLAVDNQAALVRRSFKDYQYLALV